MSFSYQIPVTDRYASLDCDAEGGLRASDERGRIAGVLIAMIGRHHGLRMEAFRERVRAVEWHGGLVGRSPERPDRPRGSPLWAV